jgi:hypothetical protein
MPDPRPELDPDIAADLAEIERDLETAIYKRELSPGAWIVWSREPEGSAPATASHNRHV